MAKAFQIPERLIPRKMIANYCGFAIITQHHVFPDDTDEYTECPCCGAKPFFFTEFYGVRLCINCGAFFGEVNEGTAEEVVHSAWHEGESKGQFYYDFTFVDAEGKKVRRHGWADKVTHKVVQSG